MLLDGCFVQIYLNTHTHTHIRPHKAFPFNPSNQLQIGRTTQCAKHNTYSTNITWSTASSSGKTSERDWGSGLSSSFWGLVQWSRPRCLHTCGVGLQERHPIHASRPPQGQPCLFPLSLTSCPLKQ